MFAKNLPFIEGEHGCRTCRALRQSAADHGANLEVNQLSGAELLPLPAFLAWFVPVVWSSHAYAIFHRPGMGWAAWSAFGTNRW